MTPAESDTRPAEGAVRPPLPPHDLGAELHAISAVLWRDLCAHELTAADFWCPEYREIWATIAAAEELLGSDIGPCTRWWCTESVLPLRRERLLEILWHCYPGPIAKCVRRLKELATKRGAVEILQRAEARLREV